MILPSNWTMRMPSNSSAHSDKQHHVAASRRVLRAVGLGRNDCFSSIRKQAICLYMPRLRIEGPRGVMASK
jgi:hypothetical protein